MANPFQIITDSACDMPQQLVTELGIAVIPMRFTLGGQEYLQYPDNREFPQEDFFGCLRAGEWATTTQVTAVQFIEAFSPILERGQDLLYIGFSSGLSGTWESALLALEELRLRFPDRQAEAVDSLTATLGQSLLLYMAVKKQCEGLSLMHVKEWVELNRHCVSGWFTVDDLNHLKKGGRIGGATAMMGTVLGIKPILQINNEGHLIPREKVRGRKQSLDNLVKKLDSRLKGEGQVVFLVHGDCAEDAKYVAKAIKENRHVKKIHMSCLGPVIGAHTGPGALGVFFMADSRD